MRNPGRFYHETRIAAAVIVAISGCIPRGRPVFNDYEANHREFHVLREGIARYVDTAGHLPDSLRAICPSLEGERCHWLPFGYQLEDAWGRSVRYSRIGGEYELRSPGRDGRTGTADDIVFRPSVERALVAQVAGCYQVHLPWWLEFPGEFRLDSTTLDIGAYSASPKVPPYRLVVWSPIAADSVAVQWIETHHARQLRLHVGADSLVGYSAVGIGMASWRGATQRRYEVIAHRQPCKA